MSDENFMGWHIVICKNCGYPLGAPLNAVRLGACPDCRIRVLPVEDCTVGVDVVAFDPRVSAIESAAAIVVRGWRMQFNDKLWRIKMQDAINRLASALRGN